MRRRVLHRRYGRSARLDRVDAIMRARDFWPRVEALLVKARARGDTALEDVCYAALHERASGLIGFATRVCAASLSVE